VAVINVGAATETEMKEKKARVEDALHATRAAVEEGIVPGGGVALLRARKALDKLKLEREDEQIGVQILSPRAGAPHPADRRERRAPRAPSWSRRSGAGKGAFGLQRPDEEYEDLVKAGVIDPTKVVRTALQNAASIAGLLLTTEAVVVRSSAK
jgi:chaperonin GroEL